jgi:hypothetical protein
MISHDSGSIGQSGYYDHICLSLISGLNRLAAQPRRESTGNTEFFSPAIIPDVLVRR